MGSEPHVVPGQGHAYVVLALLTQVDRYKRQVPNRLRSVTLPLHATRQAPKQLLHECGPTCRRALFLGEGGGEIPPSVGGLPLRGVHLRAPQLCSSG